MQMGVSRPGDHFAIVRARPAALQCARRHRHHARVARSARRPRPRRARGGRRADALRDRAEPAAFGGRYVCRPRGRRRGLRRRDRGLSAEHLARRPTTRPFFFHMLRLRDVFNTARWHDQGIVRFNMTAVGRARRAVRDGRRAHGVVHRASAGRWRGPRARLRAAPGRTLCSSPRSASGSCSSRSHRCSG